MLQEHYASGEGGEKGGWPELLIILMILSLQENAF